MQKSSPYQSGLFAPLKGSNSGVNVSSNSTKDLMELASLVLEVAPCGPEKGIEQGFLCLAKEYKREESLKSATIQRNLGQKGQLGAISAAELGLAKAKASGASPAIVSWHAQRLSRAKRQLKKQRQGRKS